MESVWDYIMRRKPIFLGYFALFLVSVFASCSLLNTLIPRKNNEPNIVQEIPQTAPQYNNIILSPQAVANLTYESNATDHTPEANPSHEISISEPTAPPDFVHVDLANPSSDPVAINPDPTASSSDSAALSNDSAENPAEPAADPAPEQPAEALASNGEPVNAANEPSESHQQLAQTDNTQIAEVPLTSTPRQVSIFRTVLAVLLAVTALTLAGFSLYQAYDYFRPFIAKRLSETEPVSGNANSQNLSRETHGTDQQ